MTTKTEAVNLSETADQVSSDVGTPKTVGSWRKPLLHYVAFVGAANLIWEFAHMPLYILWETATPSKIVFSAVHCAGGDILIAFFAIVSAIVISGSWRRPQERQLLVLSVAVFIGLAYTAFSEWLNIEVRGAWAYRDIMPVIPVVGMGLSPFLQWIIVPITAFGWALNDKYSMVTLTKRLQN